MNNQQWNVIEAALREQKAGLLRQAAYWPDGSTTQNRLLAEAGYIGEVLAAVTQERVRDTGPQWEPSDHKEDK